MADIGALILPIGADPSEFQRSIKDVKDSIKDLGKIIETTPFNLVTPQQKLQLNALRQTLKELSSDVKNFGQDIKIPENSIQGLTNKIKELNQQKILLDPGTSAAEIAKLNKQIDELNSKKNNLNNLGLAFKNLPKDIDQANQSIKRSNTALTSLTLVVQDLPFGLIAIQNNIPNLVQQFTLLQSKSGGTLNAIKELGKGLVGPGGLLLAISAVTALITFAIQKYGSLGLAIKDLLGNITELDKIQKRATDSLGEYNKEIITNGEIVANSSASVADQIFKIETLSEAIKDVTLSETQRKSAIEQIQKLDPKTLENLNLQTTNYKTLDEFVKKYTESLIANAVAQEYLSRVVATTTQINTQTNLLAEISKDYTDIAKQRRELNAEPIFDPATGAELTNTALGGLAKRQQELNKVFFAQAEVVNKLWKELDIYKESAKSATIESLKFFKAATEKTIADSPLKILAEDLDAAYNLEKIISKLESYGNILLDTNNSLDDRKNALKEILSIDNEYFKSLGLGSNQLLNNKYTIEEYIRTLKAKIKWEEFDKRASELNAQFSKTKRDKEEKLNQTYEDQIDTVIELSMVYDKYDKTRTQTTNGIKKLVDQTTGFLGFLQDIDKGVLEILNKDFTKPVDDTIKKLLNFGQYQEQFVNQFSRQLRFLQEPLEGLFGTFLEGAAANWEEFANDVIKQIKRIAAALLAKGIIQGLASLLFPGAGALVGAGLKNVSTEGLADYLGLFGDGTANFGGVQPAALSMGGQVNLTLRGADLVGSLNRTNTIINRIG